MKSGWVTKKLGEVCELINGKNQSEVSDPNVGLILAGKANKSLNGAFDGDATGLPKGTVIGTATEFFKDYANGDYTPKAGGPLVGKGANYEGMASVDLAGNPRKVGSKVDIGCYEASSAAFIIIVR
jgi:hypothetical protein